MTEDRFTNTEADAARFEARRGWLEEFHDPHRDHLDDIDYYDDERMDEYRAWVEDNARQE